MDRNAVIIITGAAGFIGSCLTGYLNRKGYYNIIISDDFSDENKKHNYEEKKICGRVERDELFDWLNRYEIRIDFIFHLGAQIDEITGKAVFEKLNLEYSKQVWDYCVAKQIPLVYASSGATYGSGETGFSDFESPEKLNPVGLYGISKNEFDKWALHQSGLKTSPPFWAGLKFFDVYGPNEYHKGKSASTVFHLFQQVSREGRISLFTSPGQELPHGEQRRDIVYVKDVVDVCYWLMQKSVEKDRPLSGLYNVGTGKARTLQEIADAVLKSTGKKAGIEHTELPDDMHHTYSYSAEAETKKLREAGYPKKFYSLEDGVRTYIQHFLLENKYY